jgi:hypothetical protein
MESKKWIRVPRLLIGLCGEELQELRVVPEVFHDSPLETGHLVRSISIHGVASPAGNEEVISGKTVAQIVAEQQPAKS